MKVIQTNLRGLQTEKLADGEWALLSMRDPLQPAPSPHPDLNITDELHLQFNDVAADAEAPGIVVPNKDHARQIINFMSGRPNVIVQCTQGLGRSSAVIMAFKELVGGDTYELQEKGVHNRLLHKLLRAELGLPALQEPLISMVVRCKYPPDRLHAFILSMQRQRYQNWELVAVSDGPMHDHGHLVEQIQITDQRVRFLRMNKRLGNWGHPYRQIGIAAAKGEFIGLSNDDNYYTPGYFEQMILALNHHQADIALCNHVHSYFGWSHFTVDVNGSTGDIGAWVARKSLIDQHVWSGIDVDYETTYLKKLLAGAKVVCVKRPLFCHN